MKPLQVSVLSSQITVFLPKCVIFLVNQRQSWGCTANKCKSSGRGCASFWSPTFMLSCFSKLLDNWVLDWTGCTRLFAGCVHVVEKASSDDQALLPKKPSWVFMECSPDITVARSRDGPSFSVSLKLPSRASCSSRMTVVAQTRFFGGFQRFGVVEIAQ